MAADSHILEAESGSPQGQPEEEWTEEQIENALEHLKVLHIKCRQLRSIVPRMIEPLSSTHTTSEDALASLQRTVAGAAVEMQDFRALYTGDDTRKVFDQAKKSRQAQPQGIKTWRAREHPDWLDLSEEASPS